MFRFCFAWNRRKVYRVLGVVPVFLTLGLFGWSLFEYLGTVVPLIHDRSASLAFFWGVLAVVTALLALWSYGVCVARDPGSPALREPVVYSHGGSSSSAPFIRIGTGNGTPQQGGSDSDSEQTGVSRRRYADAYDDSSDDELALTSEQRRQTELIHTITTKDNGEPRFCLKCNVAKPDRAHHCSVCGVCVLKMDHHCPWLNNCVGFRTQKAFLLFIVYSAVYTILISTTSFMYYLVHILNAPMNMDVSLSTLAMMLMAAAFALCLLGFCGFHAYLVLSNLSTIESYESNNYRVPGTMRAVKPKNINLFDLGWRKNLTLVFGPKWKHWFVPTNTTPGDGVSFAISFDSYNELQHTG
ncbi:palmitoyltransferase for Vac8p [Coemansia sp. RSA 552]|nr:palmitoyltransferase for Vac8p [Coemansia sp. RSA 552]